MAGPLSAQQANKIIREGNLSYQKGDFQKAIQDYYQALKKDPGSHTAVYNLANALEKANQADQAVQQYDQLIQNTKDPQLQSAAYYNKGVTLAKNKKLPDAIESFKKSLILKPDDVAARENLQKAINELKKQQQQQQQSKQSSRNQQQKEQSKSQPQNKNSLSRQRVEQLLNALRDQEKELQKKLQQQKTSVVQPEKDW